MWEPSNLPTNSFVAAQLLSCKKALRVETAARRLQGIGSIVAFGQSARFFQERAIRNRSGLFASGPLQNGGSPAPSSENQPKMVSLRGKRKQAERMNCRVLRVASPFFLETTHFTSVFCQLVEKKDPSREWKCKLPVWGRT